MTKKEKVIAWMIEVTPELDAKMHTLLESAGWTRSQYIRALIEKEYQDMKNDPLEAHMKIYIAAHLHEFIVQHEAGKE